ncbi:MAG: 2-oxoacid:acceptor oxidoreductase family protein, partial [Clostridia bacterium]|nr:2-oxoacid:acceptor oxidoreductase family protein [Clostridia bacterium]
VFYIPATKLADENGVGKLANMIIVGKILKEMNEYNEETVMAALKKVISAKHADMLEINLKAIKIGCEN